MTSFTASIPIRAYKRLLFDFVPLLMIIFGAMLVAIQVRLRIAVGQQIGDDYTLLPVLMVGTIIIAALFSAVLGILLRRTFHTRESKQIQLFSLMVGVAVVALVVLLLLPEVSRLQVIYFLLLGFFFGFVTLVLPPRLYVYGEQTSIFFHLERLWDSRYLLLMMVRYNILSRYSQTILGILWIIILPLSTALILSFVFSQVLRPIDIGDVPFVSFFLVGLTFWNIFNQSMIQGTTTLLARLSLIGQVYFPRELFVIAKVGEALVDLVFTYAIMVIINAVLGIYPNLNHVYVLLLLFIQTVFTMGVILFTSYLSVLIRDIPNLISVILQLLFYFTPILYTVDLIPHRYRFIVLINPIALLIDSYRTVIIYNEPPDIVSLFYPFTISFVILYVAYRFFKRYENLLADYI